MDALHYKIFKPGDICWALIASIEEPFIYLPVKMEVFDAQLVNTLRYHYSTQILDFHDNYKVVNKYFNTKTFRQYNYDKNRLHDSKINIDSTLFNSVIEFAEAFTNSQPDEYFQILAPQAFETREDCIEALKRFESRLANQFSNTLKFYSARYANWNR